MKIPADNMPDSSGYKFNKEERLSSKKTIDKLFNEGTSFLVYPFKVVYADIDFTGNFPAKAAFAVGKKLHKKAVSRNLIKRRSREAYRLHKHKLLSQANFPRKAIVFIYVGKEILPYATIEKSMIRIMRLLQRTSIPNP